MKTISNAAGREVLTEINGENSHSVSGSGEIYRRKEENMLRPLLAAADYPADGDKVA